MQVRARLQNVEYIFIDEVSMVDCTSLYNICAKMCTALRNDGTPFGGINMIFAGDFAQLPPAVSGNPLYSHKVGRVIHTTHSHEKQQASIGKALWHQVTTVVILRQNMRQRSQTEKDAKLRTALENLRYRSCTQQDIDLLRTRVAGKGRGRPKLNQPRFRNVSVITAWNVYRDTINRLGSERFARENGQELVSFYSVDKFGGEANDEGTRQQRKHRVNPRRATNIVNEELQDSLWRLEAHLTEHHPGKLTICVGMPVMIKQNEAVECCVTNGAEAIVVGWNARPLNEFKDTLETVFVKLTSPPNPINLPGLPENIVPLTPHSKVIHCKMPNGKLLRITRLQVPIIPNFAMTDFGSQGRTRPNNVIDLQNCSSHQSIYTCLSRGSTLEGTIIIQPFDQRKLQGGISGSLRQEFRELELLDEITKMRYEECISSKVMGITRTELIYSFRKWKGEHYMPNTMHKSLGWSASNPYPIEYVSEDLPWQLLREPEHKLRRKQNVDGKMVKSDAEPHLKPAVGSRILQETSSFTGFQKDKRKQTETNDDKDGTTHKRARIHTRERISDLRGFPWDSVNHSCPYDSILTILLAVYQQRTSQWDTLVNEHYNMLSMCARLFKSVLSDNGVSMQEVRDKIRDTIGMKIPELGACGTAGGDLYLLVKELLAINIDIAHTTTKCQQCNEEEDVIENHGDVPSVQRVVWSCTKSHWLNYPRRQGGYTGKSIRAWLDVICEQKTGVKCRDCRSDVIRNTVYSESPVFISFIVYEARAVFDSSIILPGHRELYCLCGIVYYGNAHFVCRIIDQSGEIWYHDGYVHREEVLYFNNLLNIDEKELHKAGTHKASLLIYTKI